MKNKTQELLEKIMQKYPTLKDNSPNLNGIIKSEIIAAMLEFADIRSKEKCRALFVIFVIALIAQILCVLYIYINLKH